jgi:ferrochelatase
MEEIMEIVKKWQVIPKIDFVSQFFDHPNFLATIVERAKEKMESQTYDHFIFSYHGLPERQIFKADIKGCELGSCCDIYNSENQYCYRAQCFETTRLIADKLRISNEKYATCFQSRLGKDPWIQPYTENVLKELARKDVKKVLAFSPAFVADCLETTLEVGETYKDEFIAAGGEQWDLVESLNVHPKWVDCVCDLVKN